MITVHHLNNSRSQRVLWLLEELGLPYEVKRYQRDPQTMLAPPSLRAIHPLGKSPVITDGEHTIAESGAIIEYLIDRYGAGRLIPEAGSAARLKYTYWLHYAEGSAMPPLLLKLVFSRMPKPPMPAVMRPFASLISGAVQKKFIDPQLKLHIDYMENALTQSTWFAGNELTGADIQMSFIVEASAARGGLDASFPKLSGFLERIRARPAYIKALEVGGPFELMS